MLQHLEPALDHLAPVTQEERSVSKSTTSFQPAPPSIAPHPLVADMHQATELMVSTYLRGADLVEQGLTLLAQSQSLMEETGLLPPALVPAPRLAPVTDLGAFRARRQAVS